ncbi:MAG: suppressor of fused domain protein [Erysipelotrichaceae bacterium]|nr:suppressor of fused domain protein [Erysipelotrichaceae bacterium]
MNTNEMDKLMNHCSRYFEQGDPMILHPIVMEPHIDVLLYEPSEKYNFWKLVTMGASDYKMNGKSSLGNRNEYMMFVDAEENLDDQNTVNWYRNQLLEVALYPFMNKIYMTYGHSVEWTPEPGEEMAGAFIELPQVIEDTGVLRCQLGLFKTATCLQVTLLNKSEIDRLLEIGPQKFSEYLYPDEEGPRHFISQRKRDDKF